jgi:tetrahydromethanopterin S-methyltransferase subunit G
LFLLAGILGRKRHLSDYRWLYIVTPFLLCACSLFIVFSLVPFSSVPIAFVASVILGIAEAVMWILWGEHYARIKANFSIRHIGIVFGITLLITLVVSMVVPPIYASVFVAILPLTSGGLLLSARKNLGGAYPALLSKNTARVGLRSLITVCAISLVASAACYFLAAIIPWEILPGKDKSFTYGVIGGAILLLVIALISMAAKNRASIFKL